MAWIRAGQAFQITEPGRDRLVATWLDDIGGDLVVDQASTWLPLAADSAGPTQRSVDGRSPVDGAITPGSGRSERANRKLSRE